MVLQENVRKHYRSFVWSGATVCFYLPGNRGTTPGESLALNKATMGMYNGVNNTIDPFEICPITGLPVSYNFEMTPGLDAYEYMIPSVNPHTIVTITGSVLSSEILDALRASKEIIEGEIATTNNDRYFIDKELVQRFA